MSNFSVKVGRREPIERAIRRFSAKMKKCGLRREMKKRRFYTKPSEQRKLDYQRSIRRQKRAQQRATQGGRKQRRDSRSDSRRSQRGGGK